MKRILFMLVLCMHPVYLKAMNLKDLKDTFNATSFGKYLLKRKLAKRGACESISNIFETIINNDQAWLDKETHTESECKKYPHKDVLATLFWMHFKTTCNDTFVRNKEKGIRYYIDLFSLSENPNMREGFKILKMVFVRKLKKNLQNSSKRM